MTDQVQPTFMFAEDAYTFIISQGFLEWDNSHSAWPSPDYTVFAEIYEENGRWAINYFE